MAATRLTRVRERAVLGGVCAGLADHYRIDVTLVRLFFVVAAFAGGIGIVLYLAAWLIMPAPEQALLPPTEVARANARDVVDTTKRRAVQLRETEAEQLAEGARRAAREAARATTEAVKAARDALARDGSRGGSSGGPRPPSASASGPTSNVGDGAPPPGSAGQPAYTPPVPRPRSSGRGFTPPRPEPPAASGPTLPPAGQP